MVKIESKDAMFRNARKNSSPALYVAIMTVKNMGYATAKGREGKICCNLSALLFFGISPP